MGIQLIIRDASPGIPREWGGRGFNPAGRTRGCRDGRRPGKWKASPLVTKRVLSPRQGPRGLPGERGRPGPSGPAVSILGQG